MLQGGDIHSDSRLIGGNAAPFAQGRHAAAIGLMCLAGLGWSVSTAISRLVPQDMPVQQLVWARYSVHLLVLLLFVWPRQRATLWRTTRPGRQILRGLMMLAMPVLFVAAAARLPGTDVWAVLWLAPVMALALSGLLLGERPRVWQWVAVGLGFVGMAVALDLSTNALRSTLLVLPLGSALAFALFQVITRNLRDEATSTGIFYTALCVVVPLTLVPGVLQSPSTVAVAVAIGVGLSWLLVLVAIDEALKRASLGVVAPFIYTELVWTILIGQLVFGDPVTRRSVAGALLVTAGAAVAAATSLSKNAHMRALPASSTTGTSER